MILAEVSQVPVQLIPDERMHLEIRKDLIASLEAQHCSPEEDITDTPRPHKMAKRDAKTLEEAMASKTKEVLWMLENRVASTRVGEAFSSVAELISSWASSSSSSSGQEDELV